MYPISPLRKSRSDNQVPKKDIEDLYTRSVKRPAQFYGIDGCPAGWFYVGTDTKGDCQFGVLDKYSDIGLFAKRAKLTLVDIPIGLLSQGDTGRLCDTQARKAIAPGVLRFFRHPRGRLCWNIPILKAAKQTAGQWAKNSQDKPGTSCPRSAK